MTKLDELRNISADRIRDVRGALNGRIHRTPLIRSETLSQLVGREIWLKCENLQKTGSFKVRGGLTYMQHHIAELRSRGVVTVSAGNHAQAVAWSAAKVGVKSTVVMPAHASRAKALASEDYGADVRLHGTVFQAFDESLRLAEEEGMMFVHPFDDPHIILGQSTVGLEIFQEMPEPAAIVVPVGGGGLLAGITVAASALNAKCELFGVEPNGADAMTQSIDAGHAVRLDRVDTIADGLGAPMAGDLTFDLIRRGASGMIRVDDTAIVSGMNLILERTKMLTEPSGAAAVAAVIGGVVPVSNPGPVVCVLSGGNVDLNTLAKLLPDSDAIPAREDNRNV